MNVRSYIFITCILLLMSCNSVEKKPKPAIKTKAYDSILITSQGLLKTEVAGNKLHAAPEYHNNKINTSIFSDVLYSDYKSSIIFVPLYYRKDHTKTTEDSLLNNRELIYENNEESRYLLDDNLVKKYFAIDNLEKLLLFNDKQQIVDTISQIQYESYDDGLNEYFAATYKIPKTYNKDDIYFVISLDSTNTTPFNKSPETISNKKYTLNIIKKNNLSSDILHANQHFKFKNDTISLIAFGDYKKGKEYQYLLKNGVIKDSIINDYYIEDLIPVPLATATEYTFISFNAVPESDVRWTSLLGIDLESIQFVFYDRNRLD